MKKHIWKIEDDLFLIDYLMKYYKIKDWNDLLKSASREIGTSHNSVKMRISNFIHLLGGKGLENYADISKEAIQISIKKYGKAKMLLVFSN